MMIKAKVGQKLGRVTRISLVGLMMMLGTALVAEARPQRSATTPAMAMGHGGENHDAADHNAADYGGEGQEAMGDSEEPMPISTGATVSLIPASHGDHFAMGFPEGWVVSHGATAPHLTARTPEGAPMMVTEVAWQAEAPTQIVPALLNEIREKGYTMARYDAIVVDGTTTLRLWLADLPESDLPYAFISVVGYSDATAILTSRYGTRSPDLDNLLSQIHQSFRRSTPSTAEPHHP
ncbi:hypothetical protein GFS31_14790 [Leptolyngbya sp. BL0902]|uniref:hypothetical protein n=1 Tax=Leptolyngbya sp. BL0902 TaxID=1115757 RepID=UPI0018E84F51|nr:hypothetical protein [Leptolyngbya sp. BL0902]QQE64797.1 hypothetical protein GFS31_14790 [Leptolyngbya sp. BL0902]